VSARPRRPSRLPPLKACRQCGALVPREAKLCPHCGSTEFTDSWEGMIIVLDPEASMLARELGFKERMVKAIIVARKVVV